MAHESKENTLEITGESESYQSSINFINDILAGWSKYNGVDPQRAIELVESISIWSNELEALGTQESLTHFEAISSLFVKFCTQECKFYLCCATLLAFIHIKLPQLVTLIVQKLEKRLLRALIKSEVMVSRYLLRATACMSSCGLITLVGDNGFIDILDHLVIKIKTFLILKQLPQYAQELVYVLACTIPWAIESLELNKTSLKSDLLSRISQILLFVSTSIQRELISTVIQLPVRDINKFPQGSGLVESCFNAYNILKGLVQREDVVEWENSSALAKQYKALRQHGFLEFEHSQKLSFSAQFFEALTLQNNPTLDQEQYDSLNQEQNVSAEKQTLHSESKSLKNLPSTGQEDVYSASAVETSDSFEETLLHFCTSCYSRFSPGSTVVLLCQCSSSICQNCAKNQILYRSGTFNSYLVCPTCHKQTSIDNFIADGIQDAKEQESKLVKSAFSRWLGVDAQVSDSLDFYRSIIIRYRDEGFEITDSSQLVENEEFDVSVYRLVIARLEILLLEEQNIVDNVLNEKLNPLDFLNFKPNQFLEKLIFGTAEDMVNSALSLCIVCMSKFHSNGSVFLKCACAHQICKPCALHNIAYQDSTYFIGLKCPCCRAYSTGVISGVEEARKAELQLVNEGKSYFGMEMTRNNVSDFQDLIAWYWTVGIQGYYDPADPPETITLPQLSLEVARLEEKRKSKAVFYQEDLLNNFPGPLRHLSVTSNKNFEQLLIKYELLDPVSTPPFKENEVMDPATDREISLDSSLKDLDVKTVVFLAFLYQVSPEPSLQVAATKFNHYLTQTHVKPFLQTEVKTFLQCLIDKGIVQALPAKPGNPVVTAWTNTGLSHTNVKCYRLIKEIELVLKHPSLGRKQRFELEKVLNEKREVLKKRYQAVSNRQSTLLTADSQTRLNVNGLQDGISREAKNSLIQEAEENNDEPYWAEGKSSSIERVPSENYSQPTLSETAIIPNKSSRNQQKGSRKRKSKATEEISTRPEKSSRKEDASEAREEEDHLDAQQSDDIFNYKRKMMRRFMATLDMDIEALYRMARKDCGDEMTNLLKENKILKEVEVELTTKVKDLERNEGVREEQLAQLQEEYQTMKSEKDEEIQKLKKLLENQQNQADLRRKQDQHSFKVAVENMEFQNNSLKRANEELKTLIENTSDSARLKTLRDDHEKLKEKLVETEEKLTMSRSYIENLKERSNQATTELKEVRERLQNLERKKIEDLEELKRIQEQLNKNKKIVADQITDLHNRNKKLKILDDKYEKLKIEKARLLSENNELKKNLEECTMDNMFKVAEKISGHSEIEVSVTESSAISIPVSSPPLTESGALNVPVNSYPVSSSVEGVEPGKLLTELQLGKAESKILRRVLEE